MRAVFERHRAILGEHHWETINIQRDIAWTLLIEKRYDEALNWIDASIAAFQSLDGDNGMLHYMLGQRVRILVRLGRGSETVAVVQSALAAAQAAVPQEKPELINQGDIEAAIALLETGRAPKAEAHARACLGRTPDPVRTALAKSLLGSALANTRPDEARALLAKALPAYRSYGPPSPSWSRRSSARSPT
jgi:tetratricopeptide (TPR) repeat protein